MTSKLIPIAAVFTGLIALPAMAQGTPEKQQARADTEAVWIETMEVTAVAFPDPSFENRYGRYAADGIDFAQCAYDFVDGHWTRVDKLPRWNGQVAQLSVKDMEQQYPGA